MLNHQTVTEFNCLKPLRHIAFARAAGSEGKYSEYRYAKFLHGRFLMDDSLIWDSLKWCY
jgi:hypothetical protein